jgi:FAD/FMN-containing dehydrogenase
MLAVYERLEDAARSVSAIISQGIVPATLEMMDTVVIGAVEDSIACGYPRDAAAVLIIEVDGPVVGLKAQANRIKDICMAQGARTIREAKDDAERNQLWAGRRGAFGAIARVAPNYMVADCTVPRTRLPEALSQIDALSQKYGFKCGNVFHAGDGNLHPLLLFDARDQGQVNKVHAASFEIAQACVRLGGTITGEHGVGTAKMEAMRLVFSDDDLQFQRQVKKAFDPDDMLNPGKVLPPNGSEHAPLASPLAAPLVAALVAPTFRSAPKCEREWIPASPAEACEAVRAAIAAGQALLPLGSGNLAGFGNLPARPETNLRSDKLSQVIEYDPANQVAVFGAGAKWPMAQAILAENRQWIPIRPPLPDTCTLGGMVALGACGPERAYYGAPRDRLLGLKFASGSGRHISAGGKVVKNVAGYDITRLLSGSAGTLGFLTELNFRIAPVPETCRAVRARGSLAQCAQAAALLLDSGIDPVFVTAASFAFEREWEFKAGFEGFHDTVRAQVQRGKEKMEQSGLRNQDELDYPLLEGAHADDFARLCGADFYFCANLPIDAVESFLGKSESNLAGSFILADFACGRVSAGMPALEPGSWRGLLASSHESGGSVVLEKAPSEFKKGFDVFGSPRPEWQLLHRLKDALDPHAVFSPGRLPGRK